MNSFHPKGGRWYDIRYTKATSTTRLVKKISCFANGGNNHLSSRRRILGPLGPRGVCSRKAILMYSVPCKPSVSSGSFPIPTFRRICQCQALASFNPFHLQTLTNLKITHYVHRFENYQLTVVSISLLLQCGHKENLKSRLGIACCAHNHQKTISR